MPLILSVTTPHKLQAPGAVHHVESMSSPDMTTMIFRVRSYSADAAEGDPCFWDREYSCPWQNDLGSPLAQAEAHLLTLPEFAGAVQVD